MHRDGGTRHDHLSQRIDCSRNGLCVKRSGFSSVYSTFSSTGGVRGGRGVLVQGGDGLNLRSRRGELVLPFTIFS